MANDALISELYELTISIGVKAADLALGYRVGGIEVAATKSSIADIVTEGDRKTEQFIRRALAEARPDDGFLGEEFDPTPGTSGLTWVVDPVDGTVNYLYGIEACGVSIAVVEGDPTGDDWRALAGVVVDIFAGRVYSAAEGRGAFCDGVPMHASRTTELPVTLIGTGFPYDPELREKQGRVLAKMLGITRDVRRIGAACIDLVMLASGRIDFYYDRTLNPWDYMAGVLIAREAGAVVRGPRGNEQPQHALLVGANPALLEKLQPQLEAWLAEEGLL